MNNSRELKNHESIVKCKKE